MDMAIQHSVQQLTKLQEQAAPSTAEQVSPQDAAAFAKMTQAAPATAQTAAPVAQAQQTSVAQASSSPLSAATAASHNTVSVEPVPTVPAFTINKATLSAPVTSAETAVSPGDKILQSLERLGTDMNDNKTRIMEQAGTSTAGKMCQLQFEVAQFSTNQAILGQSGSKSSQGVQTLLKGQ